MCVDRSPFSMCAFFFSDESHDHQRAISCYFHEHSNHAKVNHVIQEARVSTPVNFYSAKNIGLHF